MADFSSRNELIGYIEPHWSAEYAQRGTKTRQKECW